MLGLSQAHPEAWGHEIAMNKRDAGSLQSYFIDISRIPLLTPGDEIALAKRLDACRKRLYRGILATGHGLQAILTLLHPVCRGTLRIDHVVELPRPGAQEKHRILDYLRPTVGMLQELLAENQTDFALAIKKGQPAPPSPLGIAAADCQIRQGGAPVGRDNYPQATLDADPGGCQPDFATAR